MSLPGIETAISGRDWPVAVARQQRQAVNDMPRAGEYRQNGSAFLDLADYSRNL
jgi:hypothetical protein